MRLQGRGLAKVPGAVLLLTVALALPAAAQPRYGYGPYGSSPYRTPMLRGVVDGVLSDEGGRCPVLRDRQNRNYYLLGDTRGLRPGDQVSLRERLMNRSSCGNDAPTLEVLEVRTVWTDGAHRSAYFDARRDGSFDRFILRNRDRGGWYADRYGYLQQSGAPQGDRYGQYDRNRPYDGPGNNGPRNHGQYDNGQPPGPPSGNPPADNGYPPQDPNGRYDNGYAPDGQAPNGQYDDRSGGDRPLISVDGRLDYNGSCPEVRLGNGTVYDLAGDLGNYHDGDRVHLTGYVAGSSSCGGTALEVQEIRKR